MGRAAKLKAAPAPAPAPAPLLRLDLGCGPHPREGFEGVDSFAFVGVQHVVDLRIVPWPWADNSVSEAHASHFLEHLTQQERCGFANELYRVLVPGGTCQVITPHWASSRAYGDPTHQWPAVGEMFYFYLKREWRLAQAPHTDVSVIPWGYACDFDVTYGYAMRQDLLVRNQEYQQYALTNHKEAAQDIISNWKAVK